MPQHGRGDGLGGRSSQNTNQLRVASWTGVIVKGANETVPLYISLTESYVHPDVRVFLADVRCKATLCGELITAIVPVFELPPEAGQVPLRIVFGTDEKVCRLAKIAIEVDENRAGGSKASCQVDELPVTVVDLVQLAYPNVGRWAQTLGAITYAEKQHEAASLPSVNTGGREVALLITKTHPSDVPAIFVFGIANGKAQCDRYEASEQHLEDQKKWEFIDSCTLTELTVTTRGNESIVGIAADVDFIYEPDEYEHTFHVRLRVGEYDFQALCPV